MLLRKIFYETMAPLGILSMEKNDFNTNWSFKENGELYFNYKTEQSITVHNNETYSVIIYQ